MHIIHCLRAPVGGLFRHVSDLAREQAAAGHNVGVIVDKTTADGLAAQRLSALSHDLSLGLHQVPMSRGIGTRDVTATIAAARLATRLEADVLHGHGAKGGAYARLGTAILNTSGTPTKCFYTPHGGSLHFDQRSVKGRAYLGLERHLLRWTNGIIFESDYSRRAFFEKIIEPDCAARVIPNGVLDSEFGRHEPHADASDFLFIGELRKLKGVDVLLRALATLREHRPVTATIVGEGPDEGMFKSLAEDLGIAGDVQFTGAMPAASAFHKGRVLVVPSRAESLPYIVLEAAAGGVPLIATSVGGIPEIIRDTHVPLVPADDIDALGAQMMLAVRAPETFLQQAGELREAIKDRFSVRTMARSIEAFYAGSTGELTTSEQSLTYS